MTSTSSIRTNTVSLHSSLLIILLLSLGQDMYTYLSDLKKPLKEQLEAGIANQRSRFPTSMGIASEALNARKMVCSNNVEEDH